MSADILHQYALLARARVVVPSTQSADAAAAIDGALASIQRIQHLCPDDVEVMCLAEHLHRMRWLMQRTGIISPPVTSTPYQYA